MCFDVQDPGRENVYEYHGGDRDWDYRDEKRNATLRIHYLEMYGVFGLDATCDRPKESYAQTKWHSTSDIVVVDAGAWTYKVNHLYPSMTLRKKNMMDIAINLHLHNRKAILETSRAASPLPPVPHGHNLRKRQHVHGL